jgi:hypothetical protein
VPTHTDYPWERDERAGGLEAAGAVSGRSRRGGPPKPPHTQLLSAAGPLDPARRPSTSGRSTAHRSQAVGLLRIVCWGVIAIAITIALALAVHDFPGADNYGAVEPLHFLALTFTRFLRASPGFPVVFMYLTLAGIPVTLLHELGHAAIARRRLGGEVQVSVGTAGKIANVRLGQITMFINALSHPGRAAGRASFTATTV